MHKLTRIALGLWALSLLAAPPALAQSCGDQAEAALAEVHDWHAMHGYYTRYRRCGTSEGVTESIMRLLVDKWPSVGDLDALAKTDRSFGTFVVQGIDSTADSDDLQKTADNATKQCPASCKALCRRIAKAAQDALKD